MQTRQGDRYEMLSDFIWHFFNTHSQNSSLYEAKIEIWSQLQRVLSRRFGCATHVFGSTLNGFGKLNIRYWFYCNWTIIHNFSEYFQEPINPTLTFVCLVVLMATAKIISFACWLKLEDSLKEIVQIFIMTWNWWRQRCQFWRFTIKEETLKLTSVAQTIWLWEIPTSCSVIVK